MALNFPDSPNDGDQSAQPNGVTYIWRAAKTRWDVLYSPGSVGEFDAKLGGYLASGFHVTSGDNIDNLAANSCYRISDGGGGTVPSDYNTVQSGYLTTDVESASHRTQCLIGRNGDNRWKQWMRHYDSVWSDWKLVVDGGAFSIKLRGFMDDGKNERYVGDLNDIQYNSQYAMRPSDSTNPPPDMASAAWGNLVTMMDVGGTGRGTQLIYGITIPGGQIWSRQFDSAVWSAWKLVVNGLGQTIVDMDSAGTNLVFSGDRSISVLRNGPGDLTVTVSPAFPDATYVVTANAITSSAAMVTIHSKTTTTFDVNVFTDTGVKSDRSTNLVITGPAV